MEALYKNKIVDFIEGRADAYEFYKWMDSTPEVLAWLQSKVPEGATMQEYAEENIDYFLAMLPEDKQNEIYAAHGALCKAIDEGSEEKLAAAIKLVELLGVLRKDGIINDSHVITLLLYNMDKVFSGAGACKPELVEYMINYAKKLFEEHYSAVKEVPHSVEKKYKSLVGGAHGTLGSCLNLQGYLFRFMKDFLHEEGLIMDETLGEKFSFMLDVCPEYIDGVEVSAAQIVEKIIAEVPEEMPKSTRKKEIKERIKSAFYIVDNKRPRWVQGGDWPVAPSGKPMRFVSQKRKKGKEYEGTLYTIYTFEDVDTGEIRTVEQFT